MSGPVFNTQYSEQAIIGTLLTGSGWELVTVKATDFGDETLRKYFAAIATLAEAGKPYDLTAVCESTGLPLPSMAQVVRDTPVHANITNCCAALRMRSRKRKIAMAAGQLIELCKSNATDADELRAATDAIMAETETTGVRTRHISAFLQDTFDQIEARTRAPEGVKTGIECIDQRMTSMRAGNLIVLAARPGVGKTGFALNIAASVAREHGPVFMASAEMTSAELGERMLSTYSGVAYSAIRSGDLDERDYNMMVPAVIDLKKLPFYVDDTGCPTVSSVCAEAHRLHRAKSLSLIVVDYLQLLQGEGDNRAQEVGYVSRRLKKLAKDLKCPVLALAQLNRNGAQLGKKPTLADLRDSGEIEQDADAVIFLHRDGESPNIEAIFGKGRGFPIGSEWLRWDGSHMKFVSGHAPIDDEPKASVGGGFADRYRHGARKGARAS